MDTAAYDAGLPCKNPSCKSHGQPHPNCKCWTVSGVMHAQGGSVDQFCSENRQHQSDCEYFADGGDVPENDLPDTNNQDSSNGLVPDNDLPDVQTSSNEVPQDDLPESSDKYSTPGQELLTGVEGAAQGFLGPVATGLELGAHKIGLDKALGIDTSAEAQSGRAEANPWIHGGTEAAGLGAGFLTGTGEAGLIAKAGEAAVDLSKFGKIGSTIIKGAIDNGLIQGGDEISKAMLGQGDPNAPVSSALAHIGAAGLLGSVTSGIFGLAGSAASKGLETINLPKQLNSLKTTIAGIGLGNNPTYQQVIDRGLEPNIITDATTKRDLGFGQKIFNGLQSKIGNIAGGAGLGLFTYDKDENLLAHEAKYAAAGYLLKPITNMVINKSSGYIADSALYAASKMNPESIPAIIKYAQNITKGNTKIQKGIDQLFQRGGQQIINEYATEKNRDKLNKYIEQGGINQQIQNQQSYKVPQFAEGGDILNSPVVTPNVTESQDHIGQIYPEQSTLLNQAKGRISNYLTNLKGSNIPTKLPFDKEQKDTSRERSYNKALDIANQPLSILNHIQNNTITPEHMQHFTNLYPELYNHLTNKITERMMKAQLDNELPSYKTRQGLSTFLGTPLSSDMTSQGIQAAQNVFGQQKAQQAPPNAPITKNKRNTSKLGEASEQYQTADQAAQSRQQSGK